MPRFMGLVRMEENVGTPPQALFDAMDTYIEEQTALGHFLDGGGLFGTEDAVNFISSNGEVRRVDGPYAEAKEVVGGWALLNYDTLEEAIAGQQERALQRPRAGVRIAHRRGPQQPSALHEIGGRVGQARAGRRPAMGAAELVQEVHRADLSRPGSSGPSRWAHRDSGR